MNTAIAESKLKPCPDKPNCVSSVSSSSSHGIEPIHFSGDAQAAQEKLKQAVLSMPRMQLIREETGYMHFVQTSLIFRFKDDLEFQLDEEMKVFQVRSASRVGYSDLGVNRKRVEEVRQRFAQ